MSAVGGVRVLSPKGAIAPTGTWSLGARAGDFVFVAGMRGIDPASNTILGTEEERIRTAFTNMKTIAESEGASLASCVRLTVFVTDMNRLRPL
jgi:2-iminobutanoate/2-iminopropanoate deaminase